MLTYEEKSKFFNGEQYLNASKNLIDGMLDSHNSSVLISDHEISSNELTEYLKYNSNSIILPLMFCFYQGLELLLKGFVYIKDHTKSSHRTELLYSQFSIYYSTNDELSQLFNKYIYDPLPFIADYKKANNIKSNYQLYNSFRYPDQYENQLCDYHRLKHPNNESFLPQLEELRNDINSILKYSVLLFHELDI